MPASQVALDLIRSLNNTSPHEVVRVVVRPSGLTNGDTDSAGAIDPKKFPSSVEYRSALIARQKQRTQPHKDEVVANARALGLDASAAGTLNVVLIEGEAGRVLHLLEQGGFESASLDSSLPGA